MVDARQYIEMAGFDYCFDPKACSACKGRCCRGESGSIHINPAEMQDVASFLRINIVDLISTFLVRTGNRLSIAEKQTGIESACIFFDMQESRCSIYPVRPSQCRTFPFWDHFKKNRELLTGECPGIKGSD